MLLQLHFLQLLLQLRMLLLVCKPPAAHVGHEWPQRVPHSWLQL
jgi:hypothetical protein